MIWKWVTAICLGTYGGFLIWNALRTADTMLRTAGWVVGIMCVATALLVVFSLAVD